MKVANNGQGRWTWRIACWSATNPTEAIRYYSNQGRKENIERGGHSDGKGVLSNAARCLKAVGIILPKA
jgi:hypothetical protein